MKKFIGKPREVDAEDDGKWTYAESEKIGKAEATCQGLARSCEEENIALENEFCSEQQRSTWWRGGLENPNREIFLTKIIKQYQELQRLLPPPPRQKRSRQHNPRYPKMKLKGPSKP